MAIAKDEVGNDRSAAGEETGQFSNRSGLDVELIFFGNNNLAGASGNDLLSAWPVSLAGATTTSMAPGAGMPFASIHPLPQPTAGMESGRLDEDAFVTPTGCQDGSAP